MTTIYLSSTYEDLKEYRLGEENGVGFHGRFPVNVGFLNMRRDEKPGG